MDLLRHHYAGLCLRTLECVHEEHAKRPLLAPTFRNDYTNYRTFFIIVCYWIWYLMAVTLTLFTALVYLSVDILATPLSSFSPQAWKNLLKATLPLPLLKDNRADAWKLLGFGIMIVEGILTLVNAIIFLSVIIVVGILLWPLHFYLYLVSRGYPLWFWQPSCSIPNGIAPNLIPSFSKEDHFAALRKDERKQEHEEVDLKIPHSDVAILLCVLSASVYEQNPEMLSLRPMKGANHDVDRVCLISEPQDSDCMVLVFKGTSPLNVCEWAMDYLIQKCDAFVGVGKDAKKLPGKIHYGFYQRLMNSKLVAGGDTCAFDLILQELKAKPEKNIYICGHSLGAATAQTFMTLLLHHPEYNSTKMGKILGVYTYGTPKICDTELGIATDALLKAYAIPCFRFRNRFDVVSIVPAGNRFVKPFFDYLGYKDIIEATFDFQTVGEEIRVGYIGPRARPGADIYSLVWDIIGLLYYALYEIALKPFSVANDVRLYLLAKPERLYSRENTLSRALRLILRTLVPACIVDHFPCEYVYHIESQKYKVEVVPPQKVF